MAQRIKLPDGKYAQFPDGMPMAQIEQVLQAQFGGPKEEEELPISAALSRLPASMQTGAPAGARAETYDGVVDTVVENADVPASIAGSMAGAKAGAPFGPWGVGIGTVGGGAIGAFGGSLLSDALQDRNIDVVKAGANAGITAAADVATLGAAKYAGPLLKKAGLNPKYATDYFKKAFGIEDVAPPYSPLAIPKAGSPESLRQTQHILMEGVGDTTGSLKVSQTPGSPPPLRKFAEDIGHLGVFSRGRYAQQTANNAKVIGTAVKNLTDSGSVLTDDVGNLVHEVITAGRKANNEAFGIGIDEVRTLMANKSVNPARIRMALNKFEQQGKRTGFSTYSDETLGILNEWQRGLKNAKTMPVSHLLDMQKKLNAQIDAAGSFGAPTYNTAVERDLRELGGTLRQQIRVLLNEKSPEAAKLYQQTNDTFGAVRGAILPDINTTMLKNADKGDFHSIAKALAGQNVDKINNLFHSIDVAHATATKAGIELGEKTPHAIRETIKDGYLRNIFGELSEEGFDPAKWKNKADLFGKPEHRKAAQAILGPKGFASFKRLLNAMADVAHDDGGTSVMGLMLRSKEAQSYGDLGQLLAGTLSAPSVVGPAVVLSGPVALAKWASNPKSVQKLLQAERAIKKAVEGGATTAAVGKMMEQLGTELLDTLTDEQRKDLFSSHPQTGEIQQ